MSDKKGQTPSQPGLLTLNIPDREALYAAYMPFIRHGGLFVPTTAEFALGDEVLLLLTFEMQRYSISGKVAWINPKGAQHRRRRRRLCTCLWPRPCRRCSATRPAVPFRTVTRRKPRIRASPRISPMR